MCLAVTRKMKDSGAKVEDEQGSHRNCLGAILFLKIWSQKSLARGKLGSRDTLQKL